MPTASDLEGDAAATAGLRAGVRCRFDCPRSAHGWQVRHAVVREGLSRPYLVHASIVSPNLDVDPDELVGAACEFAFDRGAHWRTLPGVVLRVQVRGTIMLRGREPVFALDVEIGPALATMAQRINCRIFQDMPVPDVLRDMLLGEHVGPGEPAEGLAAYGRTVDDGGLSPTDYLPARDYCVQYKESDLDFVLRLMHEEGIAFFFDQEGEQELMKLVDREDALPVYSGNEGARLRVDADATGGESITRLVVDRAAAPHKVVVHHHDWLMPTSPVRADAAATPAGAVNDNGRELYVPSDRRVREIYDGPRVLSSHDDSQRRAAIALDHALADECVARGSSTVTALTGGLVFEIDRPTAFERWVVLEVVHEISGGENTLDTPGHYNNNFVCVPASRFRSATAGVPRPIMRGPQTATVTGPEGEDIHTDSFGRIKVLMHWDRDGEGRGRTRRADATSSVWVPVAQTWAGAGWGAVFIPRVGMEVMLEFLDGNPDRPVVTGCLYNGRNPPPYPLPDERTRSTLRTWSTPHNGGYNELRFEDSAEREELYIRAQRDMNELVQRNHGTEVKVDQTHIVGHDRTRIVGADEMITIKGTRTVVIGGKSEKGFSGETIKVSNDYKLDVAKTILVQAPDEILVKCKGSSIRLTPNEITIEAGGGAKIVLNENVTIESHDLSRVFMDKNVEIKSNTGSVLKLDASARTTSNDKAELLLTADAKLSSGDKAYGLFEAEKITIDSGEATIEIDKKQIKVDADDIDVKAETKMALEGGGGRVAMSGGKAQVN
ncbi:MAG: type VI secretion system tip protein VgrG [Nannocystaceae bacterium]|nr:type VI secretion system tip protein VgrG [Nannocystaceae bacterium]